jgi:molecular chaperone DnaK
MTRSTIDYGIDLGTTNSAAAVLEGTEARVIKNNLQMDYTPSVVWLDPRGALVVGTGAKRRVASDSSNAFGEFKRAMGTSRTYTFARDGRVLRAEDLSAEVLKSLRGDVQQASGEQISAAVITVPAAFDQAQCAATRLAAEKAGLTLSPLLQEPVAASLAYGFQQANENTFWLVYDLGGGTFDAAVVSMRDGVFQIVNHLGDNNLGGGDIDSVLVDEVLIPILRDEYGVDGLDHSPRWAGVIAQLRQAAEDAKIQLSRAEAAVIEVGDIKDANDAVLVEEFFHELSRTDLNRLMESMIERSLHLCRRVLSEKGLEPDDLEKVLLVGGPTLSPYVRQRIGELGAGVAERLEFRIDPLTVVARGAAIFAGTQKLDLPGRAAPAAGTFQVKLEYKRIGADTEPLVGGVVSGGDGVDPTGYSIEFVNAEARPQWRSGKIGLGPNGSFMTNLWAEKGRSNTFVIELADAQGALQRVDPDRLSYTVGNVFSEVPLPHNFGVGLASNEASWLFMKGTALPAKKRGRYRTAFDAHAGRADEIINMPFIEGLSPRADRNETMGTIRITATEIARDVPAGSEVEVSVSIDASRVISVEAYIPLLDESYNLEMDYGNYRERAHDPGQLAAAVEQQKARLAEVREQADETGDQKAQETVQRIDAERLVPDADRSVAAMTADQAAADRCEKLTRDLQQAIDQAEDALQWPTLVSAAEGLIGAAERDVGQHGDADDQHRLEHLVDAVREGIRSHDVQTLEQRVDELRGFVFSVLDRKGIIQLWWLDELKEQAGQMADQTKATELFQRADRAIQLGDVEGLRAANRQLAQLLPSPPPPPESSSWLLH